MKCPNCQAEINVGKMMGSVKSDKKKEAARAREAAKREKLQEVSDAFNR